MKRERITYIVLFIVIIGLSLSLQSLIVIKIAKQSGLRFVDEDVIITINGSSAEFYARYGILNYDTNIDYQISLPFALKPWNITLKIQDISTSFVWTQTYVYPETNLFDTIIFNLKIEQNQKLDIFVNYTRDYEVVTTNNEDIGLFRYIVGSTRSWGKSLNSAHFELWQLNNSSKNLIETLDFTNWMPNETFLYFYFDLL